MGSQTVERRERISDFVARVLKQEILAGRPGGAATVASERQLAERFGVSRSSAREALRSLQAAGLIPPRSKSRAKVEPDPKDTFLEPLSGAARLLLSKPTGPSDVQEARLLVECGLARHAARFATSVSLGRLRSALDANAAAIGNRDRFVATDAAFHATLAEIPGNGIYLALSGAVADWIELQRTRNVRPAGADRRAYEDHCAVYQAVVARDPEAADQAMAAHLTHSLRALREQLQSAR